MKQNYEELEMEVIILDAEDVIMTSWAFFDKLFNRKANRKDDGSDNETQMMPF